MMKLNLDNVVLRLKDVFNEIGRTSTSQIILNTHLAEGSGENR